MLENDEEYKNRPEDFDNFVGTFFNKKTYIDSEEEINGDKKIKDYLDISHKPNLDIDKNTFTQYLSCMDQKILNSLAGYIQKRYAGSNVSYLYNLSKNKQTNKKTQSKNNFMPK